MNLTKLVEALERHMPRDGTTETVIKGVGLIRASAPTLPMPVLYEPTLCLVAQGRKQVQLGSTIYVYDTARYLVASVGVPVTGSVVEASTAKPYLCLRIDLDVRELSELALRIPVPDEAGDEPRAGIALGTTTSQLVDAAVRLVDLLDCTRDATELAPLIKREISYRLLSGPGNAAIRQMTRVNGRMEQIARAIGWIRTHYTHAWSIDDVAEVAGMSRSAFHAHFKAVTSMSPLEFRTQLRLQEARRLMLSGTADAATAGHRVGYESPSQFSREYVRLYGLSPARDARRLRITEPVTMT